MTFSIDQEVFVVDRESEYYGRSGTVSEFIQDTQCGNLEDDPLIVVSFDDGVSDGFWTEELSLTAPALPPRPRLHIHSVTYIDDSPTPAEEA